LTRLMARVRIAHIRDTREAARRLPIRFSYTYIGRTRVLCAGRITVSACGPMANGIALNAGKFATGDG
jgi:hypothetical protein